MHSLINDVDLYI